ncbi:hypothetical protein [Salinicoccus halodurans]|uniref:Uncharacterized protein n=1 Tax=Salinicoccus halodurans TaxID=407035 RepID=A0A0F7HM35_9STAP|nr:hypothetical protein [Salinicoccus halodurans]AKG74493.1 hypothetical protein AAT16_09970 [Salinicoccus halodurans]SFK90852.1 hypothetical protein SAMN05216235_2469 [Salinicoccus halodurans]
MLRMFCAVIPVLIIVLATIFDPSYIWALNLLLAILGTVFSSINFKFRKNGLSIVLLLLNIAVLVYYAFSVFMAII